MQTITKESAHARLDSIRQALRDESISYSELAELASLAPYIDPSDIELLEAAGVPEFHEYINLDAMFTPYTLDTYQTFQVYELDCIDEDIDGPADDIEYDHQAYLQDIAKNRLSLLKDNILDNVIIDILEDGPATSPAFYNFETDDAFNYYLVNKKALDDYIEANRADYDANKLKDGPGFMWFGDDNQTKLNYYLRAVSAKLYDDETYFYDQIEAVQAYEYRIDPKEEATKN